MKRYLYGWWMYLWAFRKARVKKHGAGKQTFTNAMRSGASARFIVDGQHCNPPRIPRYLIDD